MLINRTGKASSYWSPSKSKGWGLYLSFLLKIPKMADPNVLPLSCHQTHPQHPFSLNMASFPTSPRNRLAPFCWKISLFLPSPSPCLSLWERRYPLTSWRAYIFNFPVSTSTSHSACNRLGHPVSPSGPSLTSLLFLPFQAYWKRHQFVLFHHSVLFHPLSPGQLPSSPHKAQEWSSKHHTKDLSFPLTSMQHLTQLTTIPFPKPLSFPVISPSSVSHHFSNYVFLIPFHWFPFAPQIWELLKVPRSILSSSQAHCLNSLQKNHNLSLHLWPLTTAPDFIFLAVLWIFPPRCPSQTYSKQHPCFPSTQIWVDRKATC